MDSSYLGGEQGIKALTANFYLGALNRLTSPKLRRRARRLCEEGLLTGEGRRRSLLIEEIQERFKLDGKSLEPLENARLLRKEPRHGSFLYEISHDRLAEAIREKRRWRLPREVKIGLAMFVVVLVVAAALFTLYFEAESRKRAEKAREEAEQVLDYIIFDLRDKLTTLGGRALLDDIQKQVDAYYERMGSVGESDEILRRKSVSYNNRGNLFFNRGNLDSALTSYQSALAIDKKLAARDPANTEWQRDLIGQLQQNRRRAAGPGGAAGGPQLLPAKPADREKLAARDPANTEWQRDLSVSYDKIGDVQRAQGDLSAALSSYQQSLHIAEKLAARDPANTEWQRDLSVSYDKIGDVQRAQGICRRPSAPTSKACRSRRSWRRVIRPIPSGKQIWWFRSIRLRLLLSSRTLPRSRRPPPIISGY